jgi:hypothetical protein
MINTLRDRFVDGMRTSLMIAQPRLRFVDYTEFVVYRFVAIALLLLFAGDMALPALLADGESTLPACCRRDGKHHCAMLEMLEKQERDAGPSWRAAARKCPLFPKSTPASCIDQTTPLRVAACFAGAIVAHPVSKAQSEVLYRISHSRARQKRGPPSLV